MHYKFARQEEGQPVTRPTRHTSKLRKNEHVGMFGCRRETGNLWNLKNILGENVKLRNLGIQKLFEIATLLGFSKAPKHDYAFVFP